MNYLDNELLRKTPPVKRAAYSDRTAYLMADISRLVYEKLPNETSIPELITEIKKKVTEDSDDVIIENLIKRVEKIQNGSSIVEILKNVNMSFETEFIKDGTEAMLVKIDQSENFEGMLILAFRGTEIKVNDILTDIKADLIPVPDGRAEGEIHKGFYNAFIKIEKDIEKTLSDSKYQGIPLYITGHSLGGALAMVATKFLSSDSTGATYTFGAPRVANDKFFELIKTPVYRVVHNSDAVPRVPFGEGFAFFLTLLRLIPISGFEHFSEFLREKFLGYTHYGNLVFLTSDSNGKVIVKKSPNIFSMYKTVIGRLLASQFKAAISDHSIAEYSNKLHQYAIERN